MEQDIDIQSVNSYALDTMKIDISDFPTIIAKTCEKIENCDKKVIAALKSAKGAKDTAEYAAAKEHGMFSGKNDTLDALQEAAVSLAKSQLSSTEAIEMCFDNQKVMANSIAYLFAMGCMNMTANRTVVREIQMRLSNASKEKLSALARQELQNVVMQLKAQEDLHNKIERHASLLKDQDRNIERLNEIVNTLQNKYGNLDEKIAQIIKDVTRDLQAYVKSAEILKQQTSQILASVQRTSANFESEYQSKRREMESDVKSRIETIGSKIQEFESNAKKGKQDLEGVVSRAMSEFQERVPHAIAKLDEDASKRKEELNKAVIEAQNTFKTQLEAQDESFQKELASIRKRQNRKLILTSIVSILVSSGIAAVLSLYL